MHRNPGALANLGWNDRVLALFNELEDPSCSPARVVRVERTHCLVVGPDGAERAARCQPLPAVGDWVGVGDEAISHVLPRFSAITRRRLEAGRTAFDSAGSDLQVLAANLDFVIISAPADRASPARVEREVAIAWESGAQPLVAVTKSDLDADDAARSLGRRLLGVDVLAVSALDGAGLDELQSLLRPAKTAVLFGPSGAGKSTLINALVGHELLPTGAVRESDHRGRHTTTSRQLVVLPTGGILIDTPGLRSLALTAEIEVERAFPEIETLARSCRFADCRHETEPGCAVTSALSTGALDRQRFASYRKLEREVAAEERRSDPLAQRAATRVWKARAKAARLHDKRRSR
jgi:ribosome biogenesis GTPase / thiamine phosphate phosphatase